MKLKTIIDTMTPINELMQCKIPIATAYKLKGVASDINDLVTMYEAERTKLLEEYANQMDDGGYEVPKDNVKEFTEKLNELLAQEIDMMFDKVSIDSLGDIDIAPAVLLDLDWLIE